jgi:NTE family protein
MALLSDMPRSASVRAIRDCRLIELSRQSFEDLLAYEPTALIALTRTIVERLSRSIHGLDGTGRVRTVVLLPAGDVERIRPVAEALAGELGTYGPTITIDRDRLDGDAKPDDFGRWVQELEARYEIVLLVAEPGDPVWSRLCIGQADRVLLIGEVGSSPSPNTFERTLLRDLDPDSHVRIDLILMHNETGRATAERWTHDRPGIRCFNIRPADLGRLGRMLTGRAVNLVLSGGGARGLAHIGVLRALEEASIPVDVVTGVSFGAVIGAHLAMGRTWEETREEAIRNLVDLGSPLDLTPPVIALAHGARVRHQLHSAFGRANIEDLPLRFCCISSNLTRGEVHVHDRGPVWQALRASIAIPGLFPPMRSTTGDVLVDGAVMNNLPVDVVRSFGEPGRIFAVNLHSPAGISARDLPHDGAVSGWATLRRRLVGKTAAELPGIIETLLRTSEIGSVIASRALESSADVVFRPPVERFPLMDFTSHDALIEAGYRHALEVLEQSQNV